MNDESLKRGFDGGFDGGGKRQNTQGDIVIKILVPCAKMGGVIGKGGSVINTLRQETGAKIKAEETVPGCDERVANISAPASSSAAQDALLRVHLKAIEGEIFQPAMFNEKGQCTGGCLVRLLVAKAQIGALLGKGGAIINQMRSDSGASIRVMKPEDLPPCAAQTDELVQVQGDPNLVYVALGLICVQLQSNPRSGPVGASGPLVGMNGAGGGGGARGMGGYGQPQPDLAYGGAMGAMGGMPMYDPSQMGMFDPYAAQMGYGGNPMDPYAQYGQMPQLGGGMGIMGNAPMGGMPMSQPRAPRAPSGGTAGGGGGRGGQPEPKAGDLAFRVLVPVKSSGSLIGQGGSVINAIRQETSSFVLLAAALQGATERVCTVFSAHTPPASHSQQALNRVCNAMLTRGEDHDPSAQATFRLMLKKDQTVRVAGLLNEICMTSGAVLHICPEMSLPVCANAATDDVIEIKGQVAQVLAAVESIGMKLG